MSNIKCIDSQSQSIVSIDILEDTPGDGSRYLLYLYLFVEYKDDQAECVVTASEIMQTFDITRYTNY